LKFDAVESPSLMAILTQGHGEWQKASTSIDANVALVHSVLDTTLGLNLVVLGSGLKGFSQCTHGFLISPKTKLNVYENCPL